MVKDPLDMLPQGLVKSSKRGRVKPTPNAVMSNMKTRHKQLSQENVALKDRLAQLEEAVAALVEKKGKK